MTTLAQSLAQNPVTLDSDQQVQMIFEQENDHDTFDLVLFAGAWDQDSISMLQGQR
jgi:hypothetical protein